MSYKAEKALDKILSEMEEAKNKKDKRGLPKPKGKNFDGVSIGEDGDGFYVYTHRARSSSYPSKEAIPDSVIRRIETTG